MTPAPRSSDAPLAGLSPGRSPSPLSTAAGGEGRVRGGLANCFSSSRAVAEWVQRGGHLVISTGNNQDVVESLLKKMGVPLKLSGKQPVHRLTEVESWAGALMAERTA